jgi:hypothetical protein
MRNIFVSVLSLLCVIVFQRCSPEETITPVSDQAKVSFSLSNADLPEGSVALVTISSKSGEIAVEDEPLDIVRAADGSFVTEDMKLNPGEFSLESMIIVHDQQVIYASPKRNSEYGGNVSTPLTVSFSTRSAPGSIAVDVLPSTGTDAAKFGYGSFKDKGKTWKVAVYTGDNGNLTLTDATLSIIDSISFDSAVYSLQAKVNTLPWKFDTNLYYTFRVTKQGYYDYYGAVRYSDLEASGHKPLKIVLQQIVEQPPVQSFSLSAATGHVAFRLAFNSYGSININWGDGHSDSLYFTPGDSLSMDSTVYSYFHHNYNDSAYHHISISGDIHMIMGFANSTDLDSIGVSTLANLREFSLVGTIDHLNFSNNQSLRSLTFIDASIGDLEVSSAALSDLALYNYVGTSSAEEILQEVYENTSNYNITGGHVLTYSLSPELSPLAATLVGKLQGEYSWSYTEN